MKIGVLTSSRADYGIYLPLLQKMKADSFFEIEIIAFGTHTSKFHGFTIDEICNDSYNVIHLISALITNDDAVDIATSYSLTGLKFAEFWNKNSYDWIFCLGDRFEMSAAVQAGIPFGNMFIHIHGGETTLGAIDNIYRHQITLASKVHFTSSEVYKEKVSMLTNNTENIYFVGSLSLDGINRFVAIDEKIFFSKYNIPTGDFALVTFHPETNSGKENVKYIYEMKAAIIEIAKFINLVISLPNADTMGTEYRQALEEVKEICPSKIVLIEHFGKLNYFSAMKYAKILIGNTSSGIIEAASFNKWVINVGDRQKGRVTSGNVIHSVFESKEIVQKTKEAIKKQTYDGINVYYKENVADIIIHILKTEL